MLLRVFLASLSLVPSWIMLSILLKPAAICIFHCKNIKQPHNYVSIWTKACCTLSRASFPCRKNINQWWCENKHAIWITSITIHFDHNILKMKTLFEFCGLLPFFFFFSGLPGKMWREFAGDRQLPHGACRVFSHFFLLVWMTVGQVHWDHLIVSSYYEMLMCSPSCVALF